MTDNFFDFIGGDTGPWKVVSINTLAGQELQNISHIQIQQSNATAINNAVWTLKGFTSNVRYAEKAEREQLNAVQAPLGRENATCAALIPIRKNEAWWALAQDQRRQIFETKSHHTGIGLKYLPAIARKLYHCRDIGQPFDFLTWFEYAPEDINAFDDLVYALRQNEEWSYIEREIDIRLIKESIST